MSAIAASPSNENSSTSLSVWLIWYPEGLFGNVEKLCETSPNEMTRTTELATKKSAA